MPSGTTRSFIGYKHPLSRAVRAGVTRPCPSSITTLGDNGLGSWLRGGSFCFRVGTSLSPGRGERLFRVLHCSSPETPVPGTPLRLTLAGRNHHRTFRGHRCSRDRPDKSLFFRTGCHEPSRRDGTFRCRVGCQSDLSPSLPRCLPLKADRVGKTGWTASGDNTLHMA